MTNEEMQQEVRLRLQRLNEEWFQIVNEVTIVNERHGKPGSVDELVSGHYF